jgi:hypothetical protein
MLTEQVLIKEWKCNVLTVNAVEIWQNFVSMIRWLQGIEPGLYRGRVLLYSFLLSIS